MAEDVGMLTGHLCDSQLNMYRASEICSEVQDRVQCGCHRILMFNPLSQSMDSF